LKNEPEFIIQQDTWFSR